MKVGRVHLLAVEQLVGFGQVPDVLQEENDLRRQGQRSSFFMRELRADK